MKALLMTIACFGIISSSAFSAERNYQCIADKLQAINSDIWYNLSSTDIETMITIPEFSGHIEAMRADKECSSEERKYQCVADSLQAINSDIWYNLSKTEIDTMLNIVEFSGHIEAVRAAKKCRL